MRPLTFIAALGAALLMTPSVVGVSALAEQDDLTCADFDTIRTAVGPR
jgi:hypothetical protein